MSTTTAVGGRESSRSQTGLASGGGTRGSKSSRSCPRSTQVHGHHWLPVGLLGPSRVQDAPDPEVWLEVADLQLRVDAQGHRTNPLWNAPSGISDGHGRGTRFTLPSPRWPLEFGPDAVGPNHSEGGTSSMCLDCGRRGQRAPFLTAVLTADRWA